VTSVTPIERTASGTLCVRRIREMAFPVFAGGIGPLESSISVLLLKVSAKLISSAASRLTPSSSPRRARAVALSPPDLDRREGRAPDRERHEEVEDAEHQERADEVRLRQKQEYYALDHPETAWHVADERSDVGEHIDGRDCGVGHLTDRREHLVQAGRYAGEVERPDRDLAEGKLQRRLARVKFRMRIGLRTRAASAT
jgi:hypothetical protein